MIEKRPIDEYAGAKETLPRHLRGVLPNLETAARIGADIYTYQRHLLRPYKCRGVLEDVAREDILASDPRTVPDKSGQFLYYWRHPDIEPLLRAAQAEVLSAASIAEDVNEGTLGRYLYTVGQGLVTGETEGMWKAYLGPLASKINFHFLFEESERGKKMVQVYVGVVDQEKTSEIRKEAVALREIGATRRRGVWHTPSTEISVDNEVVVAGFLSSEAKRQRFRDAGIEEAVTGVSAENLPNSPELSQRYGTRMIIFGASFAEVLSFDIGRKGRPFLADRINPPFKGTLRFLIGHELTHDERYKNDLGWLHTTLRESFANQGSIDLNAAIWDLNARPFQIETAIIGGLGYAFRDCFGLLTGRDKANDLGDLVELSDYIPGNLGWLNLGVREGAFIVKDDKIVDINVKKAVDLSRRLASEERDLLCKGTVENVRDHFESIVFPIVLQTPTQQVA